MALLNDLLGCSSSLWRNVVPITRSGQFLQAAQDWVQFYNGVRPHESLDYVSPDQFALEHGLPPVPSPILF